MDISTAFVLSLSIGTSVAVLMKLCSSDKPQDILVDCQVAKDKYHYTQMETLEQKVWLLANHLGVYFDDSKSVRLVDAPEVECEKPKKKRRG